MKVTRKAAFKVGKSVVHGTTLVEDGKGYRLHVQHHPAGDKVSFFSDAHDGLVMLTKDNNKIYSAMLAVAKGAA